MKKTALALLAALFIVVPSMAYAGLGATNLFCSWFNDTSGIEDHPFRYINWVQVSNPNDYSATFKIRYYKPSGEAYVFNNASSFTKTVPANGSMAWFPNDDIQQNPATYVMGSYAIEVTEGSITGDNVLEVLAGDTLGDTHFDTDDRLSMHSYQIETTTSTYLTMDGFVSNDTDNNGDAWQDGDATTWITISNPSDSLQATVKMTFYQLNGNKYEISPHDPGVTTTTTITLAPHQTSSFEVSDYISDDFAVGSVTLDVTTGSVIASYCKVICNESSYSTAKTYRTNGFGFNKLVTCP